MNMRAQAQRSSGEKITEKASHVAVAMLRSESKVDASRGERRSLQMYY